MAETTNVIQSLDELTARMPEGKVMCFTGRRPKDLCGYDAKKYVAFVSWLSDYLYQRFYVTEGVRTFISGGAQGVDQLAFWAVQQMRRRYGLTDIANVVFAVRGQDSKWLDKGAFSKDEYRRMLDKADIMCFVSGGSIKALFDRNHLMCDWSQFVLGVYPDGTWTSNKGGTSETLRYATNKKRGSLSVLRVGYTFDGDGSLVPGDVVDCWTEKEPSMFV